MKGPQGLMEFEDRWVTDMGAWFPGVRVVFRGRDLFQDLGDQRWMGLLLYGITGRFFDEKQVRLFEGLWCLSSSFPEPRLWNNRVAALAGTVRSTGALGVSAAIAISEASIYGRQPDIRAIDFIIRAREYLEHPNANLEDFVTAEIERYRGIPGYGRPITSIDERIEAVINLARELGLEGPCVQLAFRIEEILLRGRWRLHMNIAMLDAALAADQGLNRREYYYYAITCFVAGIIPCIIDTESRAEGSFFPLRCNRIEYTGTPRRAWE